jgi:hypothetical protein
VKARELAGAVTGVATVDAGPLGSLLDPAPFVAGARVVGGEVVVYPAAGWDVDVVEGVELEEVDEPEVSDVEVSDVEVVGSVGLVGAGATGCEVDDPVPGLVGVVTGTGVGGVPDVAVAITGDAGEPVGEAAVMPVASVLFG